MWITIKKGNILNQSVPQVRSHVVIINLGKFMLVILSLLLFWCDVQETYRVMEPIMGN